MVHSVRLRLLLTLIGVVVLALGTVLIVSSRSTTLLFERYVAGNAVRDQQLVAGVISADGPVQAAELQGQVERIAATSGQRIIVGDVSGRVIADSEQLLNGKYLPMAAAPLEAGAQEQVFFSVPMTTELQAAPVPLFVRVAPRPATLATAATADVMVAVGGAPGPAEALFLGGMNRVLLIAVAIAGGAALLLTLVLSRRIVEPIEALTAAAHRLATGDLTQRVRVETRDEIGTLAQAFNAMADGLARLEQLRRNTMSDVAHELRTPLSNIRGYLEAIRDGVVEPQPALIASLHEETLLLSRLIDDLQELDLAEAGQLRLIRQDLDPGDIIGKAVLAIQPLADEHRIELHTDVPALLPPIVGDADRLGQVLRNLLTNALQHTPPGGSVVVGAQADGPQLTITVRDTGAGIAPEHLPHLFDRFYRADPSRTRRTGGSGLGLAIVKQLVQAHGGTVAVHSAPGAGATFVVTLPLAEGPTRE